ncbi:MAG TPA: aminodeoxychorismate/anthranilate synthase component II [Gemmatimonadales bacterium]|nr:aminodeoxychorismate/anthranilate synthase component II [Gemmatimonadales bacterium]
MSPEPAPHLLVVDNHDSFTFNLVDGFATLGAAVDVLRNDVPAAGVLALAAARGSCLVVLSPGPGGPADAGCSLELVRRALGRLPLFGVCLGHQTLVEALGGAVGPAGAVVHGRAARIRHAGHPLFAGLPAEFAVGRYHSLAARQVPAALEVVARGEPERGAGADTPVMAVAHRTLPAWGVQFHPESILTTHGQRLLANVLRLARHAAPEAA